MWAALALLLTFPAQSSGYWDFHGELPSWKTTFPDYDCWNDFGHLRGEVDWKNLRLQAEAEPAAWRQLIGERLLQLHFAEALEVIEDQLLPECFLGTLFAAAVRFGECSDQEGVQFAASASRPCSAAEQEVLSKVIQGLFQSTQVTLELLIGTRWPVLAALDAVRLPLFSEDPVLNCDAVEAPVLDWPRLRRAFAFDADWFQDAKPLVYNRDFQANWLKAMEECSYGFAMVSLWKLVVCAETQAECVSQYAVIIDDLFRDNDWREVASSGWGLFGFMDRVRSVLKRHEFRLDFSAEELQGNFSGLPAPLFGVGSSALATAVEGGRFSASFAGVLESVLAGWPQPYTAAAAEVRKLLYITMVFGPKYVPYIPRFVARAEALGISNLVLFCLDEAAMASCRQLPGGHKGRCIPGTPSILNKFTLPLIYLWLGVDVFWLDFDIFLLQDPTPAILGEAERRGVDLLVSGSFADDCICSGLVYFRATKVVAQWLLVLLSWMYEHVYTHDQQAFSAFLAGRPDQDNATTPESISSSKLFKMYLEVEVPHWALLDPVTEFVSARVLNTTGWTGDLDKMIIFHFLHGDSEVNRDHSAYGWNSQSGYNGGTSVPLLDVFYNQSDEQVYREPLGPSQLSMELQQALLASRRPERPREMLHCGVLQLNPYSPGRMSPDG